MSRALSRGAFAAAIAAAAFLAGARADPASRTPSPRDPAEGGGGATGERMLFVSDFEDWELRVEQLPVEALGWEQDFDALDRPRAMAAAVVDAVATGRSRALRLPAGGGRALLRSRRLPEPGLDPTHPPAAPGERLVVAATVRWDDLGPGSWRLGVRFARELDPETGRPAFGSLAEEIVPLLAGGGAARGWSAVRAEAIVPAGAVGWRLELGLDATRERRAGSFEIDDVRVAATPRAIVRFRDPLRRVGAGEEAPVEVVSVGLPPGEYEVDLAVIDVAGEVLAGERLPRYVDESHPIRLVPSARLLAARPGDVDPTALAASDAEIRRLVVRVRGRDGREWIRREEPFALLADAAAPRGRLRHGFEVPLPLPAWVEAFAPAPVLLAIDPAPLAAAVAARGPRAPRVADAHGADAALAWPRELAAVPETQRAARVALREGELPLARAALAPLFAAVPRWYLEEAPDAAGVVAALSGAEPDLRFGLAGGAAAADADLPSLLTAGAAPIAGAPPRFAARLEGASLGADPETWAAVLHRLEAAGATEVYLVDPVGTLFRAGPSPEEGYAPQPAWLAWRAARRFLAAARAVARERWIAGDETALYDTVLYEVGDRGAAAFIPAGTGPARPARIELRVDGAARATDASGRAVPLPPADDGRIAIDLAGRFLLVEGVDLPLERTARSLAIVAAADGFALEVENHLGGRALLEPELDLPPGYELRGALPPRTVEAGTRARWELAIEAPPSAGIEGTERTRGTLAIVRPDGRRERVSFERPLPLECSRLDISLAEAGVERATVRIANRESAPVAFHLHLQAGPGGRGERTFAGERLAVGESRDYELPLAGGARPGGDLWVGVTFTDGERGYYNRTFPLP